MASGERSASTRSRGEAAARRSSSWPRARAATSSVSSASQSASPALTQAPSRGSYAETSAVAATRVRASRAWSTESLSSGTQTLSASEARERSPLEASRHSTACHQCFGTKRTSPGPRSTIRPPGGGSAARASTAAQTVASSKGSLRTGSDPGGQRRHLLRPKPWSTKLQARESKCAGVWAPALPSQSVASEAPTPRRNKAPPKTPASIPPRSFASTFRPAAPRSSRCW
mmetsp:Transcript_1778/g.5303  ORF Transcript_1778/g.5303 Transcript_1778/m.5303 type:complete len:229 (-) Transcript_1778:535-1221(-)